MAAEENPHADILRAIEHFALLLAEAGVPRMPARVFAYMLADDAAQHTAGELAAGLQVSPAAISGAVRFLQQGRLVIRGRERGARVDHYRLPGDDLWVDLFAARIGLLGSWEKALGEAAELLGPDRPGTARLRESREFFAFVRTDMPELMERWRAHRIQLRRSGDETATARE